MRKYKTVEENYITSIGTGSTGIEITNEEYEEIQSILDNLVREDRYNYRLKTDLTWEVTEALEEDIEDDEVILGEGE